MKRVLITGKDSYIGESVARWLARFPDKYSTDTIDMRDDSWRGYDFSRYDTVFHVAGIAHVSPRRVPEELYYTVNRDLAIATAIKAQREGVRQFIFMSSFSVFDGRVRVISENTVPNPVNAYGKSKLEAELGIRELENSQFKVVIIRSPMVYGKGAKGNYPRLARIARILPVFPDVDNRRSMIYIDNLCEFVRLMIENEERGLFFPQNREYVKTSEMVRLIAEAHGKRVQLIKTLNPLIRILCRTIPTVDKVFGDLVCERSLSEYRYDYRIVSFRDSIMASEK